MAYVSWFQKKCILIPVVLAATFMVFLYKSCTTGNDESLLKTKIHISLLKKQISHLEEVYKELDEDREVNIKSMKGPMIYFITPTYTRYTQQADLVRLSNTLKHVRNLHWILVEDSNSSSSLVSDLLKSSGLTYTHLNIHTQSKLVRKQNDPRWKRHRGVDQRNLALSWIRKNVHSGSDGVLYFGDDDNTYSLNLFKEMRYTRKISMWPVALVGGLRFEGPVCSQGKVLKFFTAWMPSRKFPVDMAAFAINIKLLFKYPSIYINPEVSRGYLESDFLEQLELSVDDIEAKGNDCNEILVWHTQTAEPNMKGEIKLRKRGMESNPKIII